MFNVPAGLLRILNRDLQQAGIAKRDERGRTLDIHALRTTFGTLLSKGGVAPRTAQAAMRHSDIRLTMQVYTDPKLLDVRGALDALPALPLGGEQTTLAASVKATGTEDLTPSPFAPRFAPTADNASKSGATAGKRNTEAAGGTGQATIAASADAVNENTRLSSADNRVSIWAARGSNPRPHGCDPCALAN